MDDNEKLYRIIDLSDYEITNKPFVIDIDIKLDTETGEYWEVGMTTKYKGDYVEILECLSRREYKKVIDDKDGVKTMQSRQINTLVIRKIIE